MKAIFCVYFSLFFCILSTGSFAMEEDAHKENVLGENACADEQKFIPPYNMKRKNIDIMERKKRKNHQNRKKSVTYFPGRHCYHCGAEKTTQWRTGPNNTPHSLCNACGLHYMQNKEKEKEILPQPERGISVTDLLNK